MIVKNKKLTLISSLILSLLTACASNPAPDIKTVADVNLPKFMGDWYVIASIPTMIETDAFNAVENYTLAPDGSVNTTFTFNSGSLDGKLKTFHPHGFIVKETGNAIWGMQFIWPIKAEYRIAYLNENYTQTIIARNKRDYVWIMARTPNISDQDFTQLTAMTASFGYDLNKLRKVQHYEKKNNKTNTMTP